MVEGSEGFEDRRDPESAVEADGEGEARTGQQPEEAGEEGEHEEELQACLSVQTSPCVCCMCCIQVPVSTQMPTG